MKVEVIWYIFTNFPNSPFLFHKKRRLVTRWNLFLVLLIVSLVFSVLNFWFQFTLYRLLNTGSLLQCVFVLSRSTKDEDKLCQRLHPVKREIFLPTSQVFAQSGLFQSREFLWIIVLCLPYNLNSLEATVALIWCYIIKQNSISLSLC